MKSRHEATPGRTSGRAGAPGRGAAAGMDDVDAELPYQAYQRHRVPPHDQRVFRGERQGQMRCTCPCNFAFERASSRGDIGGPSRLDQRSREFDGAALGAAGDETGEDLQHHRGAPCRRNGHNGIVDAHSSRPISPMSSPANLARQDGATIAYNRLAGSSPGIVFLGGFRSDMTGTKALYLEDYCRRRGQAYLRFDYFGHGASSGDAALGTIGRWAEDAIAVINSLNEGPQVLVGSSMGGWIMLLAALARPSRIHGARRHRGGAGLHRGPRLAAPRSGAATAVARTRGRDFALRIRSGRLYLSSEPLRGRQAASGDAREQSHSNARCGCCTA